MTLRVLDLFAGEGGASAGYLDAGLELAGAVDLNARALSRHPVQDVTWRGDWAEGLEIALSGVWGSIDLIHASPPCQRYSTNTSPAKRESHPDLVAPVREALLTSGKPFVIENVPQAPLENPIVLSGCMFGLTVDWEVPKNKVTYIRPGYGFWEVIAGKKWEAGPVTEGPVSFHLCRRRGFEVHGFRLGAPPVALEVHRLPVMSVVGGTPTGFWNRWYGAVLPGAVKKEIMRTLWMSGQGTAESVPPAYTAYIGREFSGREHPEAD